VPIGAVPLVFSIFRNLRLSGFERQRAPQNGLRRLEKVRKDVRLPAEAGKSAISLIAAAIGSIPLSV
jgi:hypothetical protein